MVSNARLFLLTISAILLASLVTRAATVDTVSIINQKTDKDSRAIVILPESYGTIELPVVYLLHGWSGNYRNWFDHTDLSTLTDQYQMIIVCPDGGYAGWYLDSPINKDSQYESYIAFDVVDYIDKNYPTIANGKGRALCGLSMGGQGALNLLAKYPDKFAAAGSMSGVMELESASKKYGIIQLLGDFEEYPERWKQNSCLYMVEKLVGKEKGIILECGVKDRYLAGNRKLHSRLLALNIDHDYYERPGGHTWGYWVNALEYHLLYFHNFWKNQ